jgi:Rrf2 family protein
MVLLASEPDRMMSSKEMASRLGRSEAHLSKIMQRLAKAKLVTSTRGPKGGFVLKRGPREITLSDIFEAMEGPLEETNCLLGQPICPGGDCIFGDLLRNVERQAKEYLSKRSLLDLQGVFSGKDE